MPAFQKFMKGDQVAEVVQSGISSQHKDVSPSMEAAFLLHRAKLLNFFSARNRDGSVEDLLHELWLALPRDNVQIESPLSYLYSMANSLVIKHYHRENQSMARDRSWSEATGPAIANCSEQPSADRVLAGRETVQAVLSALADEGERVFRIFHRHRVDGLTQSQVAAEMGVSLGTVERDLRRARRVLSELRDRADESLT